MNSDIEIEESVEYGVPQVSKPNDEGFLSYKLLIVAVIFVLYLVATRLSAALGARIARRAVNANQRNFDEEMREARRRLQELYDKEREERKLTQDAKKAPACSTEKANNHDGPPSRTRSDKTPKSKTLNTSGYFPLMGDSSSSSVCFRRSRRLGG